MSCLVEQLLPPAGYAFLLSVECVCAPASHSMARSGSTPTAWLLMSAAEVIFACLPHERELLTSCMLLSSFAGPKKGLCAHLPFPLA